MANSPICQSETSCIQSLVPWFDQQLNLGKDASPSAAADYPCNSDGINLCEKLLPDNVTQEIDLGNASLGDAWKLQLIYDGTTRSTSKLNGSSNVCDISKAMASLTPPIGSISVEGSFPSFSLSYVTKLGIVQDEGLRLVSEQASSMTSGPVLKSPRPSASMMCGPTSDAMLIQGLINYYPSQISPSADPVFRASFNFPSSTALRIPVINAIDAVATVEGTDPLAGGGFGGALKKEISNFVGGSHVSWSPGDLTYDGLVNRFDLTSVLYMNMRQGYLNAFNLGRYKEHDQSMGDETLVSFERIGGHVMAAVGYEATPNSTYQFALMPSEPSSPAPSPTPENMMITRSADCPSQDGAMSGAKSPSSWVTLPQAAASGAPFSIAVNNPFARNYPSIKPGVMKGGLYCSERNSAYAPCDGSQILESSLPLIEFFDPGFSVIDIHLPHGAGAAIDLLSDSWGSDGHHFDFLEDVAAIGIPTPGLKATPPDLVSARSPSASQQQGPTTGSIQADIRRVRLTASSLKDLESGIDAAQGSLDLDASFKQSLSAIAGASSSWGSRLERLYVAPRLAAVGASVDLSGLTAQYAMLASADPSGFVSALKSAYNRLNQEPKAADGNQSRWPWMHPRHAFRALLLDFAARAGASSPPIREAVLELAKFEVMQTPAVPVIDPRYARSEEEQDIARSLVGALLTPEVAYRLLIAGMTADQAIPFTVTVLQHQPHYAVRSAIRSQFRERFPGSTLALAGKLEAEGQGGDIGGSAL